METLAFKNSTIKLSIFSFCVLFILPQQINAQSRKNWYQFRDKKTNLIGYKDSQGHVKISAKFGGLTGAPLFDHIIAVNEESTGKSYYLLKSGKQIGADSLYSWDNAYDYERENKIRFRDEQTDKVGFFNKDGKMAIPAIYNDAKPFRNGLALVVYSGKRLCLDKSTYNPASPCEHWFWSGVSAIINTHNKIIADSVDINKVDNIDWFTLKITKSSDTTIYTSFKSRDGEFYSFLDNQKEFTTWFYKKYLPDLSQNTLLANCYREVLVEDDFEKNGRKSYPKNSFLRHYRKFVFKTMRNIKADKIKTQIFKDDLNPYNYTVNTYKEFYTKDGELNYEKFPCFDVVANYFTKDNKLDYQNQFFFVRTIKGYKLIELAIKSLN